MIQNEKLRIGVNRIMSFLIGGPLVYAVMSMAVVSNIKEENAQLAKELDDSKFEPGRLLADAKAQFANQEFDKVTQTTPRPQSRRTRRTGKLRWGPSESAGRQT